MSHENIHFSIPAHESREVQLEAIRLQASIARGDRHLYIVAENDGKNVRVVHMGHLLNYGIETSMSMFEAYPDFVQNYPIGSLCWLTMRRDDWECAPVTTMDALAKENYEKVKSKLFGEGRDTKTVGSDNLELKGKNPRES